ncbi:MAG: helix-turn-helix transcriptional regulator [Vulcanimicrobiaceae bacterium]
MKADRLIALLLLLQNAERRTAQELAAALEVSQRTIYRDVDALAVAGVPVLADRGPAGGISLSAGYRKALTHLAEEEIRALFVANTAVLADLGLGSGLDRALDKLRGTFSDAQRRAAEKVRGRIYIDQRRWNQGDPPVEKLALLHRAVWDDRRVRLEYEDRQRALSTRAVDPFGLVSKAGVWYLVARTQEGYRSFRIDRIRDVVELQERFERPADFDLDEHWRATTMQMVEKQPRGLTVTLRASPDAIDDVCSYWPYERVDSDDALTVRMSFSSEEAALRNCVMWGAGVEILDSPALCEAVIAHARKILARYEQAVLTR